MTMKELNNANHHDEHYIVRVLNHKTGVAVEPAQLQKTLTISLMVYVNCMRWTIPGSSDNNNKVYINQMS